MTRIVAALRLQGRLTGHATWHALVRMQKGDHITYAASIAYWALLSCLPFLLLVLTILSEIASGASDRTVIVEFLLNYFPTRVGFITRQIDAFQQAQVHIGFVTAVGLLWASLGFFGALTTAVNYAWGVETPRSFVGHRLFTFVLLGAAGLLFAVVVALTGAVSVVQASWFARVLARFPGLGVLSGLWVRSVSTLLMIVVLGMIFYFVPNVRVRFANVWIGAVLTAVVWRLVFGAFSWYMRDLSQLSQIHGSIAAVVVFLVWIYLSAVIVLFGVQFTAVYDRLREGHRPEELEEAGE